MTARRKLRLPTSALIRKFGKTLALIFLAWAFCFILYTINTRFFTIQAIEVLGANVEVSIDRSRFDDQLLFFPSARYRQDLLAQNLQLEDVRIQKRFPHTLVLILTLRTPVARLETKDGMVVVDANGVVIRAADNRDLLLTVLSFPQLSVQDGTQIRDRGVLTALEFLHRISGAIPVEQISTFEAQSLRAKSEKTDIFIPQNGDIKEVAATLQTLFSRFRMKGTMPASIDVRFQKPIIKL